MSGISHLFDLVDLPCGGGCLLIRSWHQCRLLINTPPILKRIFNSNWGGYGPQESTGHRAPLLLSAHHFTRFPNRFSHAPKSSKLTRCAWMFHPPMFNCPMSKSCGAFSCFQRPEKTRYVASGVVWHVNPEQKKTIQRERGMFPRTPTSGHPGISQSAPVSCPAPRYDSYQSVSKDQSARLGHFLT